MLPLVKNRGVAVEKSLTLSGQPVILQPELLVLTSVIVATAPGFLYTLHRSMFSHMEAASGGEKKTYKELTAPQPDIMPGNMF